MNEILKEIKFDIDRILLQLLIPGLFACLPFFLIFLNGFPNAKIYFEKSDGMTTLCLFILSITVGLILEDIGSVIETKICDRINKKKYCKHEEEWEEYLTLEASPSDKVLIAEKYLKKILVRMKFELSFCAALIIMMIGLFLLQLHIEFVSGFFSFNYLLYCFGLPLLLAGYIFYESWSSSILLIKTRQKIIEKRKAEKGN